MGSQKQLIWKNRLLGNAKDHDKTMQEHFIISIIVLIVVIAKIYEASYLFLVIAITIALYWAPVYVCAQE